MPNKKPDFKTKLIYGVLVVLPILAIIVVLDQLAEILEKIAKSIGFQTSFGAGIAIIIAFILLVALCYGIGSLVHTKIGLMSFEKFEKVLLLQIPGYTIIRNIIKGFSDEDIESHKPALIQLGQPGTAVIGFIIEENDNGMVTVFVPNIPAIAMGALHIVERSRVNLLEAGHLATMTCLSEWGVGSSKILGNISLQNFSKNTPSK